MRKRAAACSWERSACPFVRTAEHVPSADRDALERLCTEKKRWLTQALSEQTRRAAVGEPLLSADEVAEQRERLEQACAPIARSAAYAELSAAIKDFRLVASETALKQRNEEAEAIHFLRGREVVDAHSMGRKEYWERRQTAQAEAKDALRKQCDDAERWLKDGERAGAGARSGHTAEEIGQRAVALRLACNGYKDQLIDELLRGIHHWPSAEVDSYDLADGAGVGSLEEYLRVLDQLIEVQRSMSMTTTVVTLPTKKKKGDGDHARSASRRNSAELTKAALAGFKEPAPSPPVGHLASVKLADFVRDEDPNSWSHTAETRSCRSFGEHGAPVCEVLDLVARSRCEARADEAQELTLFQPVEGSAAAAAAAAGTALNFAALPASSAARRRATEVAQRRRDALLELCRATVGWLHGRLQALTDENVTLLATHESTVASAGPDMPRLRALSRADVKQLKDTLQEARKTFADDAAAELERLRVAHAAEIKRLRLVQAEEHTGRRDSHAAADGLETTQEPRTVSAAEARDALAREALAAVAILREEAEAEAVVPSEEAVDATRAEGILAQLHRAPEVNRSARALSAHTLALSGRGAHAPHPEEEHPEEDEDGSKSASRAGRFRRPSAAKASVPSDAMVPSSPAASAAAAAAAAKKAGGGEDLFFSDWEYVLHPSTPHRHCRAPPSSLQFFCVARLLTS